MRFAVSAVAALSGVFLLGLAFYGQPALYLEQARDQWNALIDAPATEQPPARDPDTAPERVAQLQQQVAQLEAALAAKQAPAPPLPAPEAVQAPASLGAQPAPLQLTVPPQPDALALGSLRPERAGPGVVAQAAEPGAAATAMAERRDAASSEPVPPKVAEQPKPAPAAAVPPMPEPARSDVAALEALKSGPAKSEPPKSEATKFEPPKSEPPKSEAAKSEPGTSEPVKSDPAKSEAAKSEPLKSEAAKAEPPKSDLAKSEAVKSEPPKADTAKAEPSKSEAPKSGPPKAGIAKAGPAPNSGLPVPVAPKLASEMLIPAPPPLPVPPPPRQDIDDAQSVMARLRRLAPGSAPVQQADASPPVEPRLRPSASPSLPGLASARAALVSGRIEEARRLLQQAQLQLVFRPVSEDGDDSPSANKGSADVAHALEALSANDIPLSHRYIDIAVADLAGTGINPPLQETQIRTTGYAPAYPPR
ncbi:MAG: hypothetical protein ABSC06_24815 [Rhodopila sp.]